MKYVAYTLRSEPEVRGLAPDEQVQRDVEEFSAEIVGLGRTGNNSETAGGDRDLGFLAEIGAPGGIVAEELSPELTEHGRSERVRDGGRRLEPHLRVGQVED